MKEKILYLRKKGYSINQIVTELNCAKSTVSYHLNRNSLGGNKNKFLFDIDNNMIEQIKKLRLENKNYTQIKEILNISLDKLRKICRELNLNFPVNCIVKNKYDKETILNYYLTVKSLRKTSKNFNLSRETIRKIIGEENIIKKREITITKSKSVIDWRKRKKRELIEYKGNKCIICNYSKCDSALHFHHLNPKEKDFGIGGKSFSFEKLKKEVDKCILVCSNCHSEIHDGLINLYEYLNNK